MFSAHIIDHVNDMIYYKEVNHRAPFPDERLLHAGGESRLLREVIRTSQVLMSGFSRVVGVSASRLALMRLLAKGSPEGAGTVKIARQLGIDAAAVTRLAKEMEKDRLVVRRADTEDHRRSYFRLSAKGMRTAQRLHKQGHELERSLDKAIGAADIAVAIKVLTSLRVLMEDLR